MKTAEIRQAFLDFFKAKGHEIVPSSSLIPAGDPTLLFANSGMVQFKDVFLGADPRPYTRATTCQKCLRISGKHNDLENVGRTARHHTFFEMLGNFSFGDYFKQDAIKYAWEFLTVTLGLPKDRLWITIFEKDDEAEKLWQTLTDVLPGRILRCGEKDNFWSMGETGPCGPCSEIHYYLGDDLKSQSEADFRKEDGRYIEIWNLVFMQFNRDVSGTLNPLPKPSVDTGMGLERVAAVKQGKLANYDTDLLRNLIDQIAVLLGNNHPHYDGRDYSLRDFRTDKQYAIDVALRVAADHVRAASFLIADGVNPGSDGRGYVLRRLIRRASRYGKILGFQRPFLCDASRVVVREMKDVYPELNTHAEKIFKTLRSEEEKFLQTLDSGLAILNKEIESLKSRGGNILSGDVAFLLHDTYGFPLDMTQDILRTEGLTTDADKFNSAMEAQRERSRSARASEAALTLRRAVDALDTKFVGYDFNEYESNVSGLFNKDGKIKTAKEGEDVALVVSETPFYAESGGQIGDTGVISSNTATLDVIDTQKAAGGTLVHLCRVREGEVKFGDRVRLAVEASRRERLRVNHSATHLLHLALREVLGDHVKQAGSRVSDQSFRFDFSHFEPITTEQLQEIERLANEVARENHAVITNVLPIEEAKKLGAVALFGEKYGDIVRVVNIGPRSIEFCGGTHARRAGDLGLISIVTEGSVAAGVRRVEAIAGFQAFEKFAAQKELLRTSAELLRCSTEEFPERLEKLVSRQRELEKQLQDLNQQALSSKSGDISGQARTLTDGTKVIAQVVPNVGAKELRQMADDLRARLGSAVIALGAVSDGKAILLTAVTDNLTQKFHAGKLLEQLSVITGGKGGGKADLAQAGGGAPDKLGAALQRFQELIQ